MSILKTPRPLVWKITKLYVSDGVWSCRNRHFKSRKVLESVGFNGLILIRHVSFLSAMLDFYQTYRLFRKCRLDISNCLINKSTVREMLCKIKDLVWSRDTDLRWWRQLASGTKAAAAGDNEFKRVHSWAHWRCLWSLQWNSETPSWPAIS